MVRRAALTVALGLSLAGCGEGDGEGIVRGGNIVGETLTVYSLLPTPDRGVARDVVDGERLALRDAEGRAGAFKVNFTSLDSTVSTGPAESLPGKVASATRQAIADAQIVAVVGDLETDTALVSVPLLNSAGILHVSPGVTDPRFMSGDGRPGEPERFYPAGERTFFPARSTPVRRVDPALRRSFRVAFGRSPRPEAVGGYEAMRAVLGAIERAGDQATSRQAVIEAFRRRD